MKLWWLIVAGLVAVVGVFWQAAFTNQIFARGDVFLYFYPYWDYRAEVLRTGALPLWNPYLFMGAPFLANPQAGVLYPPNWLLMFFSAPTAFKAALVLHGGLAWLGAFGLARQVWRLEPGAAWLAASVFALGGYLPAQVEHINQWQALAWMPWWLWAVAQRRPLAAALVLALMVLAGHTQTVVIAVLGAALYAGCERLAERDGRGLARLVGFMALVGALGAGLAAAQLLPTAELTRESLRQGGLTWSEAVSFSLDPRALGRALLPGYTRGLFTEFVAYIGLTGLMLAGLGAARSHPARWPLVALAGVGLAFALGGFNPLYAVLAHLPPFDLFRVPARWLALWALGAGGLVGLGWQAWAHAPRRLQRMVLAGPLVAMALTPLAAGLTLPGETGPLGWPGGWDWAGWLAPLVLWMALVRWPTRLAPTVLGVALMLELALAARSQPFNTLAPPEAYFSVRPAMTQLMLSRDQTPPPRFVSLSALQFDPGDLGELRPPLEAQISPAAVFDTLVATKHKEVLSPNLPLTWRIPAVDGFDGGVLPLRHYADFTAQFTGARSPDGRLRENLTAAPDPRWLALMNARYLITDKVGDVWVDDVFYDRQFTLTLTATQTTPQADLPAFEATELRVLAEAPGGAVVVTATTGQVITAPIVNGVADFGAPLTPTALSWVGPLMVRGAALVDARDGAFHTLTLGPFRLAHSGDVKVYELLWPHPRAWMMTSQPPTLTTVLAAPETNLPTPQFTRYTPEHITLHASGPGWLVLADADYPGWQASVGGAPASIHRAHGLFRAVWIPAGPHTVNFTFAPVSILLGLAVSALTGLGVAGYAVWRVRKVTI